MLSYSAKRGVTGVVTLMVMLNLLACAIGSTPDAMGASPVTGWQETAVKSFRGLDAVKKSQGMATDGNRLFFSWNLGLHTMDLGMNSILVDESLGAIPNELKQLGLNHIGDIDYYGGSIYAPIEDGPAYLSPWIVRYDPNTLKARSTRFPLDREYLNEGVPWVTIDPVRKVAYTAEWNNTQRLNVHRLSDFAILKTVTLDRTVGRIQGAKFYRGMLYAARDNGGEKSVEAIDPETGSVTHLFDRDLGDEHEAEGIAFVTTRKGTTMLTSDIDQADGLRVDVHSYRVNGDVTAPVIHGMRFTRSRAAQDSRVGLALRASEKVTGRAVWNRCTGSQPKPCRKTRRAGRAAVLNAEEGENLIPVRAALVGPGPPLPPGFYRLTVVPADQADATGRPASATLRIASRARR